MKEEFKIEVSVDSADARKDIKKTKDEVEDFGKETKKSSKDADKSFDEIAKSAKAGFTAATVAIAAASAALVGMAESTREYRTAQGKLEAAFEAAGSDAQTASKVYKDLNKVLGDSDVAVEAASHLAKLTTNEKDLQKWTDICTGVFATFGDSLPIEGLTEAVNHTAKLGEVQGSLADALEWSGITIDDFNAQLAECNTEQERQKLIMDTLNGLYSDAASIYKETNAEIIAANEATENWNAQMANIGAHIEPAITGFKNLGATLLEKFEDPIEDISDFLVEDFIPAIEDIVDWLGENEEIVIAVGTALVAAKVAQAAYTVAANASTIAQTALNVAMNANPIGLVVTALAALTAGIVAYTLSADDGIAAVDVLNEEEKALVETINAETEAVNRRKTAYEESAGAIQGHMDHTTELANELLTLADNTGKVEEADRARAEFILGELNTALGTEYSMVGGVILQYEELEASIYDVIAAKTANSLLEAKNESYIEAINNEDVALQKLIAAEKDYEAQVAVTTEADRKAKEARAALNEKASLVHTQAGAKALASEAAYVVNLEANAKKEKELLEEKETKYNEASENYGYYYDTISEYENAAVLVQQGKYEEATDILKNKGGAYFEYADDVDEATQKALDALYKEAIDTGIEAKRIKKNFEDGVEGYTAEMVEESEQAHEDAMQEWEDAYDEAHDIGGDMGDGLKDGLESKKFGLLQKAKSLISSIWNAMRKEADSHSPSRKTMALGGDMGEGLKIGLDDSVEKTEKAATNLIQKSILPIEASIDHISWNNLDSSFGAALAPVADVSVKNETMMKLLPSADDASTNTTPIILQVGEKVFGEIAISSINNITRQTGNLGLIIA